MPLFSRTQQTARVVAALMLGLVSWPASGAALPPVTALLEFATDPGSRYSRHQRLDVIRGQNPVEININSLIENIEGDIAVWARTTSPQDPEPALINGQLHAVYRLPNLDSIGYVVQVKDPNESHWRPFHLPHSWRRTYEKTGFHQRLGIQARITFVKMNDEPLTIPGRSYTINDLFTVKIEKDKRHEILRRTQAMTVTLKATSPTCRPSDIFARHLRLPDISASALPNIGSTYSKSTEDNFPILCGNKNVSVFATLSDANDASNRSNILTNTGSAEGVGVQLLSPPTIRSANREHCTSTIPCLFGPDARQKGTQHQFPIQLAPLESFGYTWLRLHARYIRTGPIKPGDVQARATITFSYQ